MALTGEIYIKRTGQVSERLLGSPTFLCTDALALSLLSHFLLMRLSLPHFACPALFQNISRHTIVRSKITRITTPVRPFQSRRVYSVQPSIGAIDDDMGKEDKSKNFNLKVPKGTRDCMLRPILSFCAV